MKKSLRILIAAIMCTNLASTALAAEPVVVSDEYNDISYIWTTLRDSGELTVGDDGLLYVEDDNYLMNLSEYEVFIELLNVCNQSISDGVLKTNSETVEVESVMYYGESQVPYGRNNSKTQSNELDIIPYNGAHGCSVQACNLLNMCKKNYNTIDDYYEDMVQLALVNTDLDPWSATVSFWVNKVKEGGDWDYKSKKGFAPYYTTFCCYFDGSYNHVTSEYIGNFNYGYTGSYLFGLNTLHFGSSAVSGFDPADKEDWPAIDAGYNNAP